MILFFLGASFGLALFYVGFRLKKGSFAQLASEILHTAELEAQNKKSSLELQLKEREMAENQRINEEVTRSLNKLEKEKERIGKKEEKLESNWTLFVKKLSEMEKRKEWILINEKELKEKDAELNNIKNELTASLEKTASLTTVEAKERLLCQVEKDLELEIGKYVIKRRRLAEEEVEKEAKRMLTIAIERMAGKVTPEISISTLSLPNDEMKGRIIGREGKNIRTFEELTGVNLLVDETPRTVVLSSFDPIRKAIAHAALTELIKDGRIHPTRIEEMVEEAKKGIEKKIKEEGTRAFLSSNLLLPHPELIELVGKLSFRFSLGQNVLEHSLEVARLMGLMAGELGLNVEISKRMGLLHDIGKAASDEIDGSHALVGKELALKYGEKEEVANGIGCHHGEIKSETIESNLVAMADALSASRPGARSEATEQHLKRLQKLEAIALHFPGVEKAYALAAGKEIRVAVIPERVQEEELILLARKIASEIEAEVAFSGKIKVTVIREKKAVDYAL